MSDFWEQYKRPEWQRKRLEVMQVAQFECEFCGSSTKTLNVHHKVYIKGHKPWEYTNEQLECLCEECHERTHRLREELKLAISTMQEHMFEMLLGYAKGLQVEDDRHKRIRIGSYEQAIGVAQCIGFDRIVDAPNLILSSLDDAGTIDGFTLTDLSHVPHDGGSQ